MKLAYALQASPLTCPEPHVALTPITVLDLCDKQLFIQLCYFLCPNSMWDTDWNKYLGMIPIWKVVLHEKEWKSPAFIFGCHSFTYRDYSQNYK